MPPYRDAVRIVIGVDPAMTSKSSSDETGIIVAAKGVDGCGYILEDLSCRLSPEGWARRVVNAALAFEADMVVAEINNGGEMVESVLRTVGMTTRYKSLHVSRGKRVRMEPVVALYEQHRVFHCKPFPELEEQMCSYAPLLYDSSPDRIDALVFAISELLLGEEPKQAGTWGIFP